MTCTLDYTRDTLRYKYFVKESTEHQAKLELRTYQWCVRKYTRPGDTILDPMSGVGTVHFAIFMGRNTVAIELVPRFVELQKMNVAYMMDRWREGRPGLGLEDASGNFYSGAFGEWDYMADSEDELGKFTIFEGDCRRFLPLADPVDAVIFSPPYGSLWAYSEAKRSAKVAVEKNWQPGYDDSAANIGNLKNYAAYMVAMRGVYKACYDSLKPGGVLVTVVKDYVNQGKRVLCSKDNLARCLDVGFVACEWHFRKTNVLNSPFAVKARERRAKAGKLDRNLDIDREDIIVVRKEAW